MPVLPEQGLLDLGDQQLEYRFVGPHPGAAPTLVLLHEGLGCVGLWGEFPQRLAEATGLGIFVYSRAGYGQSSTIALPRPLDYMQIEAQQVLPRVLSAVGFTRGFLIGHSDGASIAAIYAGSVTDTNLLGISLIAPHFFTEDFGIAEIAKAKLAYDDASTALRQKLARWHKHVDAAFRGWNDAWLDPEFRNWDITRFVRTIDMPMQIVQGGADQYGTLRQVEAAREAYRGTMAVAVAVLDGVGHSPHREAPERLVDAVAGFVARTR